MLALFHDKKCCNCSNFVPCILWDFIVLDLVLSWWKLKLKWRINGFHEKLNRERACEEHMTGSWRVVPGNRFLPGGFLCMNSLPFTHTIYTLITHKCKRRHSERKTLDRFSTTHTLIFLRESYSSLVRINCSLFSFPLPLSYLERRFIPKHNPYIFRV